MERIINSRRIVACAAVGAVVFLSSAVLAAALPKIKPPAAPSPSAVKKLPAGVSPSTLPGTQPSTGGAGGSAPGGESSFAPAASAGSLAAAGSPFTVTPTLVKPFVTATFRYQFYAGEQGDYFVHCLRKDQTNNQPSIAYKSLSSERGPNGIISGSYSFRLPDMPSLYGKYSFRIFGPVRHVKKPPMGQSLEWVQTEMMFDVATFDFTGYATTITAPAQIPPLRTMHVTWTDASAHEAAWIGLFKRENNNEHPIVRKSLVNLPGGFWDVQSPAELGNYDIRIFIDHGFTATAIRPFNVTWGTLNPVISGYPSSCYPFVTMAVSYANGPPEINAMVGIFDATNPTVSNPTSWQSIQGKTSGQFVFSAPPYPGQYDIRMVDSAGNVLYKSTAFQVVAAPQTIPLTATVQSGRVIIKWKNPANYQQLAGYYIYRGTAPNQQSATPITAGPVPADRSAAASTQENAYMDMNVQNGVRYYYIVKPLKYDLQTFGPPSNEVSVFVQ